MIRRILLLCALGFCSASEACECDFPPLDTAAARNAREIFVFRLLSAEVRDDKDYDRGGNRIVGRIKVITRLRGTARQIREVHFSTSDCCGTRLDVGDYFVAFLPSMNGKFTTNSGNVLSVGREYPLAQTHDKLSAILAGKTRLEDVFSRAYRDRIEQWPVLPPCVPAGNVRLSQ